MPWFPTVVLTALALVWGWVLGRPALQNMMNGARRDPVGHFNHQLSVLGQAPDRSRSMSGGSWQAQSVKKRRLQVFLALVMAAAASFVLALALNGIFWWQHLLLDAALIGYLVLASRAGAAENLRLQNVSYLGSTQQSVKTGYARAVGDR
ncbi:MAG: hypothetical protein R2710_18295 [Acidimicrobiales bacterium]